MPVALKATLAQIAAGMPHPIIVQSRNKLLAGSSKQMQTGKYTR
jgi:hypothetical protein